MRLRLCAAWAVLALVLAGCGSSRDVEGASSCPSGSSYREDIAPLLQQRCGACHGQASAGGAAGGFAVDSYLGVLGDAAKPFAVAGRADSRLLLALAPGSASAAHQGFGVELARLTTWVVDCQLAAQPRGVHPGGIINPADAVQFHGALLRQSGYRFASCATCHGADFAGKGSAPSCLSCHAAGPTACDTCHTARKLGDGHPAHLFTATAPPQRRFACSECHNAPQRYDDPGHLTRADGSPRGGAVPVVFASFPGIEGAHASSTPSGAAVKRQGAAAYVALNRRCENVYCHGAILADNTAKSVRPTWSADPPQAECGTCHGLPPQSHAAWQTECVLCHRGTVEAAPPVNNGAPVLRAGGLHLNGRVDLGDGRLRLGGPEDPYGGGGCSACHGGAANAAPPGDLRGGADPSSLAVGAHQAHLQARHRLRGPIACGECHRVPARLDSPGHIDDGGPAEVFPAGLTTLAMADGAAPRWDRASARCSGVYCHGAGAKLATDLSPNLSRSPVWSAPGQTGCGACHGVPPKDKDHTAAMRLTECATCHPDTMDPSGAIRLSGPAGQEQSAHINGVVDAR